MLLEIGTHHLILGLPSLAVNLFIQPCWSAHVNICNIPISCRVGGSDRPSRLPGRRESRGSGLNFHLLSEPSQLRPPELVKHFYDGGCASCDCSEFPVPAGKPCVVHGDSLLSSFAKFACQSKPGKTRENWWPAAGRGGWWRSYLPRPRMSRTQAWWGDHRVPARPARPAEAQKFVFMNFVMVLCIHDCSISGPEYWLIITNAC